MLDVVAFIQAIPTALNLSAREIDRTRRFTPTTFVTFGRRGGVPQEVREKYERMHPRIVTELDRALGAVVFPK